MEALGFHIWPVEDFRDLCEFLNIPNIRPQYLVEIKATNSNLIDADGPKLVVPACDAVVDPAHAAPAALLAASVGAQLGLVQVHLGTPLHPVIVLGDGALVVVNHVAQDVGDDAELLL